MEETTQWLKKRLRELAGRSVRRRAYTCSDFLTSAEQATLMSMAAEPDFATLSLYGGAEGCERRMARFGDEELCGYAEPFPITCLKITPPDEKFAGTLTHRDYLGAIMNLGVERGKLGDIILRDGAAYAFAHADVADYIAKNLIRAGRAAVSCREAAAPEEGAFFTLLEETVNLSGLRTDALIAKAYHLSRADAQALFAAQRVFINGAQCQNPDAAPKAGDIISVRGAGRFIFAGDAGLSKKGKLRAVIKKYV